jgi:hypothetical protein
VLRCAGERLTDRQRDRLDAGIEADERHLEVAVAWQCGQQLRQVYLQPDPAAGRRLATKILESFPSCPIPEIARLGKTRNDGGQRSWATSIPPAPPTAAPRGHQRTHRTPPPDRPRVQEQGKLPATDAAARRRAHPTTGMKSQQTGGKGVDADPMMRIGTP